MCIYVCKCAYTHRYTHIPAHGISPLGSVSLEHPDWGSAQAMPDRSTTAREYLWYSTHFLLNFLQTCPKPFRHIHPRSLVSAAVHPGRSWRSSPYSEEDSHWRAACPNVLTLLAFSCSFYRTVIPSSMRSPHWQEVIKHRAAPMKFHSCIFSRFPVQTCSNLASQFFLRKEVGGLRWERGPWFVHLNSSSVLLFNSIAVQILLECHFVVTALTRNCLWCSEKGNKTHLSFESWFPRVNNKSGETLTHKPVSCPPWMFTEFTLKEQRETSCWHLWNILQFCSLVKPPPMWSPSCHSCSKTEFWNLESCMRLLQVWLVVRLWAVFSSIFLWWRAKASWSSAALWFLKMTFRTLSDYALMFEDLQQATSLIAFPPPWREIWTCTHTKAAPRRLTPTMASFQNLSRLTRLT